MTGHEISPREFCIGNLAEPNAINFKVPRIQRTYSWKKNKQLKDFMKDLVDTARSLGDGKDPTIAHYFGAFCTTESKSGNTELIIDGQQRIVTSFLFLKWAEDQVKKTINKDRIKTIIEKNKLELGKNDDADFQKLMNGDKLDPDSKSALKDAYDYFEIFIKQLKEDRSDLKAISIDELVSTLLYHFKMVKINLPNSLFGPTFHFINNRGKSLDQNELIKSHLFIQLETDPTLKTNTEDIDSYDQKWANMIGDFKKAKLKVDVFMQHYLALKLDRPTKFEKLYEDFQEFRAKSKLSDSNLHTAMQHLDDIFEWSKYYLILLNSNEKLNNLTIGRLSAGTWLKRIKDINASNIYPILLAGYKKYYLENNQKKFCKLVDSCYRLHLRVKTLGNIKEIDVYRKDMEKIAREIIKDEKKDDEAVFNKLHDFVIKMSDSQKIISIETALNNSFSTNQTPRHCLLLIEEHKYGVEKVANNPTVEHILPKKYASSDEWEKYIDDNYDDGSDEFIKKYLYNLGNMTLLSGRKNSKLSNKIYHQKIPEYNSDYKITQELKDKLKGKNSWTISDIDERCKDYVTSLEEALNILEHPIKK